MSTPLSITPPSKAETPTGRKTCTRVLAHHEVLAIDVCRAGETVALHCHTALGRIVLVATEAAFTRGCRSRLDANGNPFRDQPAESAEVRLAREAATLPAPPMNAGRGADPEVQARCERAWARYVAGEFQTLADAATSVHLAYPTFAQFVRRHHRDEARSIRLTRRREHRI